jgi:hypothetical protein
MAPARKPASAPMPRPNPTMIGVRAASRPGVASSRSESRVQMSTTLPYSGFSVPSMIPGMLANLPAHLEDDRARSAGHRVDRQAREEEDDGRPAISARQASPGVTIAYASRVSVAAVSRPCASSPRSPRRCTTRKSAVAASTAVAIAMPLVMALVVLPTASRSVRTCAPAASTSPDISAMPCALSADRPEGVHGHDDADGGQQATAGKGDEEQRDDDGAAAQQERAVDRERR